MPEPVPQISCSEAHTKLLAGEGEAFVLLDCREKEEIDIVHVPNSMWLPMSELQERVSELDSYKNTEMAVICHMGMRSQNVAAWLAEQGFSNVKSVAGGIDRWVEEVDPNMPKY